MIRLCPFVNYFYEKVLNLCYRFRYVVLFFEPLFLISEFDFKEIVAQNILSPSFCRKIFYNNCFVILLQIKKDIHRLAVVILFFLLIRIFNLYFDNESLVLF